MLLLPLLTAAALSTTAQAAPKAEQVHLQLQTGVLARESLQVEESDQDRSATQVGPGAGGVSLGGGYLLSPRSEVGGRLELSRLTLDDGQTSQQRGTARVAGTYTHWFRIEQPLRATATGMLGLERTDFDGDAQARAPFVGVGGGLHWFATPRTSLHAGLELSRTLGGRFEADGVEGSSRYTGTDAALVGGVNIFLGGKKHKRPHAHAKKGRGSKHPGGKHGAARR